MTREEMMDTVIRKFGLEAEETITFCNIAECKGIDDTSVENVFKGLMAKERVSKKFETIVRFGYNDTGSMTTKHETLSEALHAIVSGILHGITNCDIISMETGELLFHCNKNELDISDGIIYEDSEREDNL